MSLKLEIEGVMLNQSAYAPRAGWQLEEKEEFWSKLDEVVEGGPFATGKHVGVLQ